MNRANLVAKGAHKQRTNCKKMASMLILTNRNGQTVEPAKGVCRLQTQGQECEKDGWRKQRDGFKEL